MAEEYHPEEDTSNLLDEGGISKYHALIGTANWIITLGRFDIAYAVNTLSRYSAAPREGHLKALMRVFGYLDTHPNGRIIIDTNLHDKSQYTPARCKAWDELYPNAKEDLPDKMPTPKGKQIKLTVFVDANHARDKVTRRSVTVY